MRVAARRSVGPGDRLGEPGARLIDLGAIAQVREQVGEPGGAGVNSRRCRRRVPAEFVRQEPGVVRP